MAAGEQRLTASVALPDYAQTVGDGVYAIDTGFFRPQFDAAYLMVDGGRAAFIDTGTNAAVPRLLATLAAVGLTPADVQWVIPTHVHLDHAGGAGTLMAALPQATMLVHPRGARHMIDPTALYQGALAVYGQEEMDRQYGVLQPVPAARVQASSDGTTIHLGQRALTLIDTPGHARHHHCIWDEATRGWFTGDTFGLSYREFDTAQGPWMLATSTPVQFEPEALRHSIQRLLAREPQRMYLTHFGPVPDVPQRASQLLAMIDEMAALGRATPAGPQRHDALKAGLRRIYHASLRAHGCTLPPERIDELLVLDIELNAQGMACWLDRPAA